MPSEPNDRDAMLRKAEERLTTEMYDLLTRDSDPPPRITEGVLREMERIERRHMTGSRPRSMRQREMLQEAQEALEFLGAFPNETP